MSCELTWQCEKKTVWFDGWEPISNHVTNGNQGLKFFGIRLCRIWRYKVSNLSKSIMLQLYEGLYDLVTGSTSNPKSPLFSLLLVDFMEVDI